MQRKIFSLMVLNLSSFLCLMIGHLFNKRDFKITLQINWDPARLNEGHLTVSGRATARSQMCGLHFDTIPVIPMPPFYSCLIQALVILTTDIYWGLTEHQALCCFSASHAISEIVNFTRAMTFTCIIHVGFQNPETVPGTYRWMNESSKQ